MEMIKFQQIFLYRNAVVLRTSVLLRKVIGVKFCMFSKVNISCIYFASSPYRSRINNVKLILYFPVGINHTDHSVK